MLYENLLNCVDVVNLNDNMSNNMLDVDLDSEMSIDEVYTFKAYYIFTLINTIKNNYYLF
jgi:hypothetical protein